MWDLKACPQSDTLPHAYFITTLLPCKSGGQDPQWVFTPSRCFKSSFVYIFSPQMLPLWLGSWIFSFYISSFLFLETWPHVPQVGLELAIYPRITLSICLPCLPFQRGYMWVPFCTAFCDAAGWTHSLAEARQVLYSSGYILGSFYLFVCFEASNSLYSWGCPWIPDPSWAQALGLYVCQSLVSVTVIKHLPKSTWG